MHYKKLIVDVIGIVLTLTTIFFFFIYILFNHNCVDSPLKETWTLTMYFFSGISTLGSVLAIIYTLYRQSIEKRPHFLLEITRMDFNYDNFLKKFIFSFGIKILNTGENAYTFSMKLNHNGDLQDIKYGFHQSNHEFDVFKSVAETEKHHYITININLLNGNDVVANVNKLNLYLTLNYRDKNHSMLAEQYQVIAYYTNNKSMMAKLQKV